jgi:NitT/TauT family transport system permease protein
MSETINTGTMIDGVRKELAEHTVARDDYETPAAIDLNTNFKSRLLTRIKRLLRNLLPIAFFLLFWEAAPYIGLVNEVFIPPFSGALKAIFNMFLSGEIFQHVSISLYRSFLGLALAIFVGFTFGALIGCNRSVKDFLGPLLSLFSLVSPMALFPFFIIVLGIGEESKVGIIFWSSVWPILLSTISGVSHVDLMLVKAAKTMGASTLQIFKKVVIPSAMPEILPGLRISTANSIIMLCAAEMLGAKKGLGHLIAYSQQVFQIPNMYAAIILIATLGWFLNYLLNIYEEKMLSWKKIVKD